MIPLLASGGKSFREKIPKTDAMADILWYPYECEIICRKLRQHEDLRKKAFLC